MDLTRGEMIRAIDALREGVVSSQEGWSEVEDLAVGFVFAAVSIAESREIDPTSLLVNVIDFLEARRGRVVH